MAIGSKYGTAKGANVVIVKYPELADNNPEDSSEAAALDALTKIVNDIRENSLQKRAVVNLSYGFHGDMDDEALTQAKQLIGELLADDVVVITASGNENVRIRS